MIAQQTIDTVKNISIKDIISYYVPLKKKGSSWLACCPFHDEKTPSFNVNEVKDIFKCFGCGKSGDAIEFVMKYRNFTFNLAIKEICHKTKIPYEEDQPLKEYIRPLPRLEILPAILIDEMQRKRCISNNTLLRFKVTHSEEWMPLQEKEIPVICFNYFRNNELVNIKFRGAGKSFKLQKDAERIFYNIDALYGCDTAVIVEGEIDCLSMYEAGIYNCVSVPNGATKNNNDLQYVDNCWQFFEDKKKIIIAVDNDEVGKGLMEELARRFGKARCLKVEYPEACKDANDVLVKIGKGALKEMVENARSLPIEGVIGVEDFIDDVIFYYENGYPEGAKTYLGELDKYITFMPGQFTTVTGIPGSGKSEIIDAIVTALAKNHNWNFAYCSFENQPSSIHTTKIIEKFCGKAFDFRKDKNHRLTREEMEYGLFLVDKYISFINISQADVTLDGILSKCEELVTQKGVRGLVIDPWNYIEHKIPIGYSETQYVSEALSKIKAFAFKNGVHVFIVAHPTKLQKDKKTGKFEVPTMYSISGSAHFFNKTDNGLAVYRDFESNVVDVYIQKIRYAWLGKVGFCTFSYDTYIRQYNPI